MKSDWRRWSSKPDLATSIFLNGNDEGFVDFCKTQVVHLIKQKIPEAETLSCTQAEILDDPSLLQNQPSLFGPAAPLKILLVEGITDKICSVFDQPLEKVTLVLPQGISTSIKKLKALHEKDADKLSLSCYLNSASDKRDFAETLLKNNDITLEQDALRYLLSRVDEDSATLKGDIAKLALYQVEERPLTLEEVEACCQDILHDSLQELIYAIASRNKEKVVSEIERLKTENIEEVMFVRLLNYHFLKLFSLRSAISAGKSIEDAFRAQRPPIFFKAQPVFKSQLRLWSGDQISEVLARLRERELELKQGKVARDATLGRFILSLTTLR